MDLSAISVLVFPNKPEFPRTRLIGGGTSPVAQLFVTKFWSCSAVSVLTGALPAAEGLFKGAHRSMIHHAKGGFLLPSAANSNRDDAGASVMYASSFFTVESSCDEGLLQQPFDGRGGRGASCGRVPPPLPTSSSFSWRPRRFSSEHPPSPPHRHASVPLRASSSSSPSLLLLLLMA